MDGTDKVVIALGFFTLVGFIAYLYFLRTGTASSASVSLDDVKRVKENWIVRR